MWRGDDEVVEDAALAHEGRPAPAPFCPRCRGAMAWTLSCLPGARTSGRGCVAWDCHHATANRRCCFNSRSSPLLEGANHMGAIFALT